MPNQGQKKVVSHHRQPRMSTVVNRRRIGSCSTEQTLLNKSSDVKLERTTVDVRISQAPTSDKTSLLPAGTDTHRAVVDVVPASKTSSSKSQPRVARRSPSGKELKEAALAKAISSANQKAAKNSSKPPRIHFGFKRVMLAASCAVAAVAAIAYLANISAPDFSLKVAAMQTGIEASYPAHVPRGFSLTDITSEDGKITISFKNYETNDVFALIEERSAWDSEALLSNFVRPNYGNDYTTVKEQGLTLYISDDGAAWVNGGIIYKINVISGSLTKKQLKSIAISL